MCSRFSLFGHRDGWTCLMQQCPGYITSQNSLAKVTANPWINSRMHARLVLGGGSGDLRKNFGNWIELYSGDWMEGRRLFVE